MVSLYDILGTKLSYDVEDVFQVITYLDQSTVPMSDLVRYFGKQFKEQRYNDYEGIVITADTISKLKAMIPR